MRAYTEDAITFTHAETKQLSDCKGWLDFQYRSEHIKAEAYLFQAQKFSHKVYAQLDAFESEHRYVVWLDMDILVKAEITQGFLKSLVKDHFVAYLGRQGCHTESGILIFDTEHPDFPEFVKRYRAMYDDRRIFMQPYWTDCHAFDAAIVGLQARNLTPDAVGIMDVFSNSPISHLMTHDKGALKYLREGEDE